MSAALQRPPRMRVADFIEMIRPYPDEERWELLDGIPVLMTSPTERHQMIVMNLLRVTDRLALAKGCVALPGLSLLNDEIDDFAAIPDVLVRCGAPLDGGYVRDPIFLAEVLSRSTMTNDRGRKLDFYRSMASLRTILLVYPREIRVEAWQRDGTGWRDIPPLTDLGASLPLPELDGSLSLAEIYTRIDIG